MKMRNQAWIIALALLMSLIRPAAAQRWSQFLASQDLHRVRYNSRTHTYWFGTFSNLVWRFDGRQFVSFSVPDARVNGITALAIDEKNERLWVGSRFGLFRYDIPSQTWTHDDWKSSRRECRLPTLIITSLFVDSGGTLWFGFDGAGIGKKDSTGWYRFTAEGCTKWDSSAACWVNVPGNEGIPGSNLASNYIDCMAQDNHGNMYFGTRGAGLLIFDRNGKWTVIDPFPSDSTKTIRAIASDREGNKWLGTLGGVCRLDSNNRLMECFTRNNSGLVDNWINAIWIESYPNGDIKWFATSAGVSVLDSASQCMRVPGTTKPCWKTFTNSNSGLAANDVQDLIGDRDGNLWFALLQNRGASKLNNNWSELSTEDGLSSNFTYAVEQDSFGRLWVGPDVLGESTNGRVDILDGGIWRALELYDAQCMARPRARDFLSYGSDMWIATNGCGVIRVSKDLAITKRIRVNDPPGTNFPSNNVFKLALRYDKATPVGLWAATEEGLVSILVRGQDCIIDATLKPALPSTYITALAHDYGSRLWVGTVRGLSVYDGIKWTEVPIPPFPPNAAISALAVDSENILWVGTPFGLARFDSSLGWTSFSQSDGLPDEGITAVEVAPDGTVWCGTNKGAAAFIGGRWTAYNSQDGPRSDFIYQIAFGPADVVWFATWGGGISRYHRTKVGPNTYIEKIFNIVTETNVTFHYSGYDLNTPTTDLRYQYALDNPSAWSLVTPAPFVTLPITTDGWHTFYVRAIDKDGNVDSTAAKLRFNKVRENKGGAVTIVDSTLGQKLDSLWLYVPPYTLPSGSSIRVRPVQVDTSELAKQNGFTGIAFALVPQPENTTIAGSRPMTLTIFYSDSVAQQFEAGKLALYRRDPPDWTLVGGTADTKRQALTTALRQLGIYALFVDFGASPRASSSKAHVDSLAAQPRIFSPKGDGFSEKVTISFDLDQPTAVTMKVYNLAGRLVKILCENALMNSGRNAVDWHGDDYDRNTCPSGMYLICLEAAGKTATKTVMVVNQ
jgi:ligand-binding sensor domain-containing protein